MASALERAEHWARVYGLAEAGERALAGVPLDVLRQRRPRAQRAGASRAQSDAPQS